MKRILYFFTAMLIISAISTTSFAQTKAGSDSGSLSVDDQVSRFIKQFEDAYNRADHQALADLFTTDAERTDADGNTVSGSSSIGESYKQAFSKGQWKVMLRLESTARVEPGTVIGAGSWKVTGTDTDGNPVTRIGTFNNEISIKDKQMRIRRMKVNNSL
jgi:uncharacterized protein (TIGR02246 family)